MNKINMLVLVSAGCLTLSAVGQESSLAERWRLRFDIGGTIPENPTLSDIGGSVTGGDKMELSAGMAFDFAAGYRVTPWLLLEGELGFTYNEIKSVGNWSYPNSALSQMLMMVNAEFSYPIGRLVPFAGIGGGGVYSSVSFGNYYYYYFSDSDGWGDDFVPAAQAFAGFRYEFNRNWTAGVSYRFLATPSQNWNVEWWNGAGFNLGVDRVCIHSICFTVTGSF
ncbi:MAG: porin family protein [Verrucomicrobia subdivision 3 bacterium]|nr:porin family protein [Limisphaerales bacterium]